MRGMADAFSGMKSTLLISLIVVMFTAAPASAEEARSPVVIVANVSVTEDNLSLQALRRIFMAEQQYWPDRSRIILLVQAPNAYEREIVLDRIYGMTETEYKKYWVAKMFRAEVPSGPKIVFSVNMARELVQSMKGAITFIPADEVQGYGKIIRVDGKLPNDPGYPL
ncbi:MAG: hypothetical protein O7H39_04235 [Gammaproteobacteria bacterium]|nr:hypothetical protein [Gammaproteobacteria bacterium]